MSATVEDDRDGTAVGEGLDAAPRRHHGNSFFGDVRVNLARWVRKAIRNPTAVVLEVFAAVFSLVLFTAVFGDVGAIALERGGFGDVDYLTYLLPAVLMQATIGSAFSAGSGLVADLESGMFRKVVVMPMSWTAVFAGKAAADLLALCVPLAVVFAIGLGLGVGVATGPLGVVGIVAVCLLVGLLFMAVSNVIGLLTRDDEALNAATMLFMFPLLFLSPAFLPLSALPDAVTAVATINPVTYGVDAVRSLLLGRDVLTVIDVSAFGGVLDTLVPAVAVLLAYTAVFGAVAVWALARASNTETA